MPADFPVYPGAAAAEVDPGPVSGGWLAPAKVDAVAAWYRKELEQTGFTIENLSSPLEGGTRILDLTTDLPECRIQVIFGPADDTTMVTVLYGAGCSAGAG